MKTVHPLLTVCLVSIVSLLTTTVSADWPQFRGPNGAGVVRDASLPDSWSTSDYAWTVTLPGSGFGSPVVHGKQVFLLAAEKETATRRLVCLDLTSGQLIWQREYTSKPHHLHARNTYASGTPCVDAEAVYAVWADPDQTRVIAHRHDGGTLWDVDLGTWIGDHGFAASPMVVDDLVVIFHSQQAEQLQPGEKAGQSRMVALDRRNGKVVWATNLTTVRPCYGTPCVYQPANGPKQLVDCNTGDGTFGLDLSTGKMLWNAKVFEARCVSSPVIAGDLIVGTAGSGGGGNHLVAVRPGAPAEQVYRIDKQAPYVPTPVFHDGKLFCVADRGVASCFNAESGEEIWTERLGGNFYASPIVVGNRMLCISLEGVAHLLNATEAGGAIGKVNLGGAVEATPAVADGMLLLRVDDRLHALNCRPST